MSVPDTASHARSSIRYPDTSSTTHIHAKRRRSIIKNETQNETNKDSTKIRPYGPGESYRRG
eukprot:3670117-Rhodomonas_salina.3